jgi:hypothetical protein
VSHKRAAQQGRSDAAALRYRTGGMFRQALSASVSCFKTEREGTCDQIVLLMTQGILSAYAT